MNYLEHHLGDYAKRALSFSMLEHGAYSVLRDRYFTKEQPIAAAEVYRVASARTREEKAAVDAVLAEFFQLEDGLWRCPEFDAQLVVANNKIASAQENGKKGGRPKGSTNKTKKEPKQNREITDWVSVGSISETQPKAHQTPDTNHQSPELNTRTSSATDGGRVSRLMRQAGIADGNPGHPDLLALIAAGATDAEFAQAAGAAVAKGKGFAYALGVLKGQRAEAAAATERMHQGAMPQTQRPPTAAEQRVMQAVPFLAAPHLQIAALPKPITLDEEPGYAAPAIDMD